MELNVIKKDLKERFESLEMFRNKRLLAIQLNGFSHSVFYDSGKTDSQVEIENYSGYTSQGIDSGFDNNNKLKDLFSGLPNYAFQNNAKEIVYIAPNKR
jgi:hypothetical protein